MKIKYENEKEKLKFEGSIEEFNAFLEAYKSMILPAEPKKEKGRKENYS